MLQTNKYKVIHNHTFHMHKDLYYSNGEIFEATIKQVEGQEYKLKRMRKRKAITKSKNRAITDSVNRGI